MPKEFKSKKSKLKNKKSFALPYIIFNKSTKLFY